MQGLPGHEPAVEPRDLLTAPVPRALVDSPLPVAGQAPPGSPAALCILLAALWIAAVADVIHRWDVPIASWVRDAQPWLREAAQSAAKFVRAPGNFLFTLAVACALLLWHRARWRAAVLLAISGALSGVAVHILKWSVGRQRPAVGVEHAHTINPFAGGLEGLINQKNLSFPSGDTALAFATAACLGLWFGRWRLAFFAWAAIVGAQRILTNSHYPSEVLAAAGLGVVCVPAARWLYRRLFGAVPN